MNDPYKTLGLGREASAGEIKSAYRKLAKQYHPDLNAGNADRFKNITGAYDILSDPEKKKKFDRGQLDPATGAERSGSAFWSQWGNSNKASKSFNFDDFDGAGNDIFSSFFKNARGDIHGQPGKRSYRKGPSKENKKSKNTNYKLTVPFTEATLGIKKHVTLSDGKVVNMLIPPGTETGAKLRLKGQGRVAADSSEKGDAVIEITVEDHENFVRKKQDIHIDIPISLSEAIAGATIVVPTIYGNVTLKVPANSNTGATLRLKGKGVPKTKEKGLGDQYICLQVVLPEKIDQELKDFVETWNKKNEYDPRKNMKIT